jgi:hypothetical protein
MTMNQINRSIDQSINSESGVTVGGGRSKRNRNNVFLVCIRCMVWYGMVWYGMVGTYNTIHIKRTNLCV